MADLYIRGADGTLHKLRTVAEGDGSIRIEVSAVSGGGGASTEVTPAVGAVFATSLPAATPRARQKTNAQTTTGEALETDYAVQRGVSVRALDTNIATTEIRDSAALAGYQLRPGESQYVECTNLNQVLVKVGNVGEGVCYVAG